MDNLLEGSGFSLLSNASTDKAGRAYWLFLVRFIDCTTLIESEKSACVTKLGESKNAAVIMAELEEMFRGIDINKSLIHSLVWMVQMGWVIKEIVCKEKYSTYHRMFYVLIIYLPFVWYI